MIKILMISALSVAFGAISYLLVIDTLIGFFIDQSIGSQSNARLTNANMGNAFSQKARNGEDSVYQKLVRMGKPAGVAAASYKSYLALNALTPEITAKKFMAHGMVAAPAYKLAPQLTPFLAHKFVKRAVVFTMGISVLLTVEEFFFPNMSAILRLAIALFGGGILVVLFILLQKNGIMK